MKKLFSIVLVFIILISALFLLTGCEEKQEEKSSKSESKSSDNVETSNSLAIIENMKSEAKEPLENMFNYNSSGYTRAKAETVFEDESRDESMMTSGVYKFEENGTTYYYYRGDVDNNYLKFGKNSNGEDMYWRIIRTNKDGTLRLLYYGTSTGDEDKAIGKSKWHSNNMKVTDTNYSTSDVKTVVDEWYKKNIEETGYDQYIAEELFVCDIPQGEENDKESKAYDRIRYNYFVTENANPSLEEVEGAENLKLKVGLITADELLMAGATTAVTNTESKPYVANSKVYWTMTPNTSNIQWSDIYIAGRSITACNVDYDRAILPVLSINKEALSKITGNGTKDNPYEFVK